MIVRYLAYVFWASLAVWIIRQDPIKREREALALQVCRNTARYARDASDTLLIYTTPILPHARCVDLIVMDEQ